MPINVTVTGRSLDSFTNWANSLNGDGTKYLDNNGQFTTPSGESGQFASGTDNPPVATPTNPNAPAQYYNTSTKFIWNWDIGTQAWIAVPKVYRALLTQSSTNPPSAVVLENTLGEVPTYDYSDPGAYDLLVSGDLFDSSKTIAITPGYTGDNTYWLITVATLTSITIANSLGEDNHLNNTPVQILVYP